MERSNTILRKEKQINQHSDTNNSAKENYAITNSNSNTSINLINNLQARVSNFTLKQIDRQFTIMDDNFNSSSPSHTQQTCINSREPPDNNVPSEQSMKSDINHTFGQHSNLGQASHWQYRDNHNPHDHEHTVSDVMLGHSSLKQQINFHHQNLFIITKTKIDQNSSILTMWPIQRWLVWYIVTLTILGK